MYIDAGTGSMLLQAGAAIFFTVLIFCKEIFKFFRFYKKPAGEKGSE